MALQQLSREAHVLPGRILWEAFPDLAGTGFASACRSAMERQTSGVWEESLHTQDRWLEVRAHPSSEGILLSFHDITARKRAEQRLLASPQWFSTALRSIGDAVITTDRQGRITFLNPAAEAITGWTGDEATGRPLTEVFRIINEHTREEVESPVARVLHAGGAAGLADHTLLIARDGTERPIEDSVAPIQDEKGELQGAVLVFRDVSEKAAADKKQRENAEGFRAFSVCSPVGLFLIGPEGEFLFSTPRSEVICGFRMEEIQGNGWTFFLSPEDRESAFEDWKQAVQGGKEYAGEFRFQRPAGKSRWVKVSSAPTFSDTGAVTGHVGTVEDITERKQAEEEQRKALDIAETRARQLHALARASLAINSAGALRTVLEQVTGQAQEIIGAHYAATSLTQHPEGTPSHTTLNLSDKYADQEAFSGLRDADALAAIVCQENRPLKVTREERAAPENAQNISLCGWLAAPLVSNTGRNLGLIQLYDKQEGDFTAEDEAILIQLAQMASIAIENVRLYEGEKRAHQESEQAAKEIEALNQRLRRAMAETHHRVKNNLQVISALVDMQMLRDSETVPQSELQRLGQHIGALAAVHDLLTQEARHHDEVDGLSTQQALGRLLPLLQGMVGERRIQCQVEDIQLPLRQGTALAVLVNELVSNALKHGRGVITITLARAGEQAHLTVCDEGPGFPRDFDARQAANTGLELVENLSLWDLGGKIFYGNRPGSGARVAVTFPVSLPGEKSRLN